MFWGGRHRICIFNLQKSKSQHIRGLLPHVAWNSLYYFIRFCKIASNLCCKWYKCCSVSPCDSSFSRSWIPVTTACMTLAVIFWRLHIDFYMKALSVLVSIPLFINLGVLFAFLTAIIEWKEVCIEPSVLVQRCHSQVGTDYLRILSREGFAQFFLLSSALSCILSVLNFLCYAVANSLGLFQHLWSSSLLLIA